MIGKCAASVVLVLALAGCSSGSPTAPAGTPVPTAAGTAACVQALEGAYKASKTGADTGDLPKPKACAGIADDAYLQLAMQAVKNVSNGS